MGRSIIWALAGLVISTAGHCSMTIVLLITVVTTVIGGLDWHFGELIIAILAAAAVVMFFTRPGHSLGALYLAAELALIPIGGVLAMCAFWALQNLSRKRRSHGC